MTKAAMTLTLPTAFAYLLLVGIEPAEAQRAPAPTVHFYAAPGPEGTQHSDNLICSQQYPCSPQGAIMACHSQPYSMCAVHLADGLYLNAGINIFHFKAIHVMGNCGGPQNVILRNSQPNTAIVWVQDHSTGIFTCLTMDVAPGTANVSAIAGRQHTIIDYGTVMFGPMTQHVTMSLFSVASCIAPIWIIGGGPVLESADDFSYAEHTCEVRFASP